MKTKLDIQALEREVCKESFFQFVKSFWDCVSKENPVWNWHIPVLCNYLQQAAIRVFNGEPNLWDSVTNLPPGSTKSILYSIMFPCWLWLRMPHAQIICISHTEELAINLALKSRDVIRSNKFRKLFPEIDLRTDMDKKAFYQNSYGGWRLSKGMTGKPTGYHAHFILIDDPISPEDSLSDKEIATANRIISRTLTTRKVDKVVTHTALIMQRLHQNDPSAFLLTDKNSGIPVKHINLPGSIEDEKIRKSVRPRKLVKYYKNSLFDPIRLPKKVLDSYRSVTQLGEYGFAGQILQHPVPLGGGMFKTDRIEISECPNLRYFKEICRFWDKAGTEGAGAFTVGALLGVEHDGKFWVLDIVRGQWESSKREKIICQTVQMDFTKVKDRNLYVVGIEQEPGSGGKESALATVKRLAGYRVVLDRPTGTKQDRADPFSVQVNQSNVFMAAGEWNKTFIDELQHFPHSTYKDQVDASAGAFNVLCRKKHHIGGIW